MPFDGGEGCVSFAVYGVGPLRLRVVALVASDVVRRRPVRRRSLLRFADALDAGRYPVPLPGTGAVVEPDLSSRLPYAIVRWPGGSARIALAGLASPARSAAQS